MTTTAVDDREADKRRASLGSRAWRFLAVVGPGILVMLADTDAGSIVTAAQSGAQWGYKLLLFQLVLIPILFFVQELTARLGIVTGKGHAVLIREHYGATCAWISTATLVVACAGALLTEFGGIAAVGSMVHLPVWLSLSIAVGALSAMAVTGSYRSVERIALAIGAFEVAFVAVAVIAHPTWSQFAADSRSLPITDAKYLTLVSANIGAVIMPWMVFYQQSSVIEKGLTTNQLAAARLDTLIGSVVTQLIMAAVLVATASALAGKSGSKSLESIGQVSGALTHTLGPIAGNVCFGLGVVGASFVAAVVVTLTAARTLGELTGFQHSLDRSPSQAPWFYGVYILVLLVAAGVVLAGANLVTLSVGVQVMNAMLLPIVLGFLFLLARKLPQPYRLQGWYAWLVGGLMLATTILGLYAGVSGKA